MEPEQLGGQLCHNLDCCGQSENCISNRGIGREYLESEGRFGKKVYKLEYSYQIRSVSEKDINPMVIDARLRGGKEDIVSCYLRHWWGEGCRCGGAEQLNSATK